MNSRVLRDELKKGLLITTILIILVLSLSTIIVSLVEYEFPKFTVEPEVYVGTTYCGDSVAEGKLLIDKVRHYSNLFVLQSSTLHRDFKSVYELGDYAVSSGLCFLPYFGTYADPIISSWITAAKQKWGNKFLGVYYSDEPGGKMLDGYVEFENQITGDSITKTAYGDIVLKTQKGIIIHYEINGGIIHLSEPSGNDLLPLYSTFYPNGTITGQRSNQPKFESYADLISIKPFKNNDEIAQHFLTNQQQKVTPLKINQTKVFTSDYALYWWDYLSGYDVMLAQIGWNISLNKQIALVRGAANAQNKDWGIVITWKYNQPPYLDTGTEILSQMCNAYESGAKYFVLFNYYDENSGSEGTLKPEHFKALEDFWNGVVKNPKITHNSIKADSVIVLPKNYGWGMRWREDKIWGIFNPDNQTEEIWASLELISNDYYKIDVVYEDTNYPLTGQYQNIYRLDQR
jgi:hypothetical protein